MDKKQKAIIGLVGAASLTLTACGTNVEPLEVPEMETEVNVTVTPSPSPTAIPTPTATPEPDIEILTLTQEEYDSFVNDTDHDVYVVLEGMASEGVICVSPASKIDRGQQLLDELYGEDKKEEKETTSESKTNSSKEPTSEGTVISPDKTKDSNTTQKSKTDSSSLDATTSNKTSESTPNPTATPSPTSQKQEVKNENNSGLYNEDGTYNVDYADKHMSEFDVNTINGVLSTDEWKAYAEEHKNDVYDANTGEVIGQLEDGQSFEDYVNEQQQKNDEEFQKQLDELGINPDDLIWD